MAIVELSPERVAIAQKHNMDPVMLWAVYARSLPEDGLARYILTDEQVNAEWEAFLIGRKFK
jgi:hypothetical protein